MNAVGPVGGNAGVARDVLALPASPASLDEEPVALHALAGAFAGLSVHVCPAPPYMMDLAGACWR